jgi:archaellum biogenesis ATPase FlaH|tara:strand:+ start:3370 stop:4761 length:1392 start_codon:yes stop_codon:yes gene_type:complete
MSEDYSTELQKLYIDFLLADKDLFVRCNAILESSYFDRQFRDTVDFIKKHVEEYSDVPMLEQVNAVGNIGASDVRATMTDEHKNWFMDNFEQFCRHKALEAAILQSADKLENKEYGTVEGIIKAATEIGLAKDFGTNYWEDPAGRIQTIKDSRGQNSTGWMTFDKFLYGGFNTGELNIFAGGSGSGKSLFMQNLALNWALQGKNVVYISLELSEELCSMRLDAMLTGMGTKDVMKNASDVELRVKMASKKAGGLQIVQMKNGCTVNDIRAYLKEFQIQNNIKVDALLVDYLDLMMPITVKVNPNDQFIKDKFVSEELRNLAIELGILFVTASQLNRSAVDEIEFDHSHIAGGISKINTADNLIGIFSSRAMRERGRVQIQFMKTRSSSGVGQKLDLKFNIDSLRIEDLDEDEQEDTSTTSIYQKLKTKSSVAPAGESVTENNMDASPQVDATDRLKSLLRKAD